MPEQSTSRHAVLTGAAGIAALAAAPAGACGAGSQSVLIAEIRRLHARHQALILGKGDPARPAYEAAIAASEAAGAELERLCEHILDQPVQCWEDVAVRAELAKAYAHEEEDGSLTLVKEPCDLGDVTLGTLLEAVMGGAHV